MILLRVILGRDCCRFLVQPFFGATVSPRCFTLLFFSLLPPLLHRVKAEQYKEFVFCLSPALIIVDSNIISKVIAAFCCTWMKNCTYMGATDKICCGKIATFFLLRVDGKCCSWPLSLKISIMQHLLPCSRAVVCCMKQQGVLFYMPAYP